MIPFGVTGFVQVNFILGPYGLLGGTSVKDRNAGALGAEEANRIWNLNFLRDYFKTKQIQRHLSHYYNFTQGRKLSEFNQ